jgi:hypothetical protein
MDKSSSASLRILLVCVGFCLKSVLRYKFLILDACHLSSGHSYYVMKYVDDPWLFFEAKRGPRAENFGKRWPRKLCHLPIVAFWLCPQLYEVFLLLLAVNEHLAYGSVTDRAFFNTGLTWFCGEHIWVTIIGSVGICDIC